MVTKVKDTNAQHFFKEVWIFGPDHNGAFADRLESVSRVDQNIAVISENTKRVNWAQSGKYIAVIGDGKQALNWGQLRQLKNKVNKDTRICLCAHGSITDGGHSILLRESIENTADILWMLDHYSDDPLQIYLSSCYAGAANRYTKDLKEGTVLVTVSAPDDVSYESPFTSFDEYSGQSVEECFMKHIRKFSQTTTYNRAGEDDRVLKSYTYRPFASRVVSQMSTVQDYVSWSEKEFVDFVCDQNILTKDQCQGWSPLPKLTSEESESLLFRHVVYLIRVNKLHTEPEKLQQCLTLLGGVDAVVYGPPLIHYTFDNNELCHKESLSTLVELGANVNIFYSTKSLLAHTFDNDSNFNNVAFTTLVAAGANPRSMLYYTFDDKDSFNAKAFDALLAAGATANDWKYGFPMISFVFDEHGNVNRKAFDALVAAGADLNVELEKGVPLVCDFLAPELREGALDLLFAHGAKLPKSKPENVSFGNWEKANTRYKAVHRDIEGGDLESSEGTSYVRNVLKTRDYSARKDRNTSV